MTKKLITPEELEPLTEAELHALYCKLLNDMARLHRSVPKCPVVLTSLENVQNALDRRRRL